MSKIRRNDGPARAVRPAQPQAAPPAQPQAAPPAQPQAPPSGARPAEHPRSGPARGRSGRQGRVVGIAVYALLAAAAVALFVAALAMPVYRIYGSAMAPTLAAGDIVAAAKGTDVAPGDLVVFTSESKIMVRRCIAGPGQQVDIDESGSVYVDGVLLDEPYLTVKTRGLCDIDLPCQVPQGQFFVLGDDRAGAVDSRSTAMGCVPQEQIIGKLVFRVWPLSGFGAL